MNWAAKCTDNQENAGCVLKAVCSGKGQLCVEPELIGSFQD